MLVKFTEKNKEVGQEKTDLTEEGVQKIIETNIQEKEVEKWTPSEEQLSQLEEILKNNYPVKEEVEEERFKPSEEELQELENILSQYNEIITDNNNEVETEVLDLELLRKTEVEEPITEENQYRDTVYGGLLNREIQQQPEEVEKKNDEKIEQLQDYKILNYKNRDA